MLKQCVAEALSTYAGATMWTSRFFLSISLQMGYEGYSGFALWMRKKSSDYGKRGEEVLDYIVDQGTHPLLEDQISIPTEFGDMLEAFEQGLVQMMRLGDSLERLVELVNKEKDNTSYSVLQSHLLKHVADEAEISRIISRLKRGGGESGYSIYDYMMDKSCSNSF